MSHTTTHLDAAAFQKLLRSGNVPDSVTIAGNLKLMHFDIKRLPKTLCVKQLTISDCPQLTELPTTLITRRLVLEKMPQIQTLPAGLHCHEIVARDSRLTHLPADLRVDFRLDLQDSVLLETLPPNLTVGTLNLRGCTSLRQLPRGLRVSFLNLTGCAQLREWPDDISITDGELLMRGTNFQHVPAGCRTLARLDLCECSRIRELPDGLDVRSWLDVAGTGLATLPESLRGVALRWRGVAINRRIAFQPETLTKEEILSETNAEVRRVMLERVGFEWFFDQVNAEVLDHDRDPGGDRRLLKIDMQNDEPLVCVTLNCPSTARRYVLRVPPNMVTCHQAAAWLAGFDHPELYQPLVET